MAAVLGLSITDGTSLGQRKSPGQQGSGHRAPSHGRL